MEEEDRPTIINPEFDYLKLLLIEKENQQKPS